LFQTNCGASGDMVLAAMIDLLDAGDEFKQTFENIGLAVTVAVEDTVKNHLKCKKVVISASPASHAVTFATIDKFISQGPFCERIKANANRIFSNIFKAEAEVHGEELKNVHLHEIGADDSLIDILGFCWLWEKLDCCPLFFTTLVTGQGNIQTRHGLLPVPPPAVLNLIKGLEYRSGAIEDELLTPTAAAILATCGCQADGRHTVKALKIGSGGGHKTFAQVPNILRAILSEKESLEANDRIWVLEFNLDDSSGEMVAAAGEKIIQAGAMDIFISSGLMKKGRPGFLLTVLCAETEREKVITAIFRESTAIGLRQRLEDRVILGRETRTIRVSGSDIRIKISSWQNRPMNIKPEFADVCLLADKKHISVKEAMLLAQGVINEKYGSYQD
ncbi:MAG: nickel pincer cofactor biosynthesis protein LarC, partial [Candidatus Aminicenantes bacterium]|nr:nickel pincer cofactor biosynthesis protein LarC [Candidatus Aminicenantes bacterium]